MLFMVDQNLAQSKDVDVTSRTVKRGVGGTVMVDGIVETSAPANAPIKARFIRVERIARIVWWESELDTQRGVLHRIMSAGWPGGGHPRSMCFYAHNNNANHEEPYHDPAT